MEIGYRASVARWEADLAAHRPKTAEPVADPLLHTYVQERPAGRVRPPDGTAVSGPAPPRFTGDDEPHREDRARVQAWSPERTADRTEPDLPDDESVRISHEAVYQELYVQLKVATGVPVFLADPGPRGCAARTRTPTGCRASTSPGAPTCHGGAPRSSRPSPTP